MKWYVYILYSKRGRKTYTGQTDDVEERLAQHNSGKTKYTSRFKPWDLIYTEECPTREVAEVLQKRCRQKDDSRTIEIQRRVGSLTSLR